MKTIDSISNNLAPIIEYVGGDKIAARFKGLTIPVMEFNEAFAIIKQVLEKEHKKQILHAYRHGRDFGKYWKAESYYKEYVERISNEESEN